MRMITAVWIGIALLAGVPETHAQGNGRGRGHNKDVQENQTTAAANASIGTGDARLMREWFSQPANLKGLPPGLAKKEQLPPGLQKQLARNGQLPPGLQKKIQPLPPVLERQLTPLPEGSKRFVLNGSVVLLDQQRNIILDIVAVF
jgi:hypothetical protein